MRQLYCLLSALCVVSTANAQTMSGYINVRDYIEASSERVDHTDAIRRASAEAISTRNRGLLFPPGEYKVSDTIDVSGLNEIVGQAYPRITQTNAGKDIFYSNQAWRMTVRGLSFEGGRDQVALGNGNVDQGFLVVSDCRFTNASGVAVRFLRNDETKRGTASTFCLVEKSTFTDCMQTLISVSDQAHLRDCWISTKAKKDNKAVIENYGFLTCQNIIGVPRVSHTDQRWIDNHGTLTCKMFRFGGEGAGFTPVVNYVRYRDQDIGHTITLEDCAVSSLGNNRRACAVYLEEIPNQVVVRNSSLGGVPAVIVNSELDLGTYLNSARPGMLHFDVAGNIGEFAQSLPQAMIDAAAKRVVTAIDYGSKQLSDAETREALAHAVEAARSVFSADEPGVTTWKVPKGQQGRRQLTDASRFQEITLDTHRWDLGDTLDGTTERCSDYLALAAAGDDIVLMSRMDRGSWPHVRIRSIEVDLDKTPFLTWRLKDNGVKGGHQAMKVIRNDTNEMTVLMENYDPDQYGYYAFDLREVLGVPNGVIKVDLKYYLCGSRTIDALSTAYIMKGEAFIIDFIRLEAAQ